MPNWPSGLLSEALEYALKMSQAPMRFYGRQVRTVDLLFVAGPATTGIPALPPRSRLQDSVAG